MRAQPEGERDVSAYLKILRDRWLWVLAPMLILPAVAFSFSATRAERFTASAEVLLNESAAQDAVSGSSQNTAFRNRILENEIRLANSDQSRAIIADRLGVDESNVPAFDVAADPVSDVLIFSTTRPTADGAATVANVAAESYVAVKQLQVTNSISDAVSNLESRLASLQAEREAARSDLIPLEDALARSSEEDRAAAQTLVDRESSRISGQIALIDAQISATANSITDLELSGELALGGTARIVSTAVPPRNSTNGPVSRNLVLGVLAGAITGVALALLRENLDNKIRTLEDLEQLGVIALGSVPRADRKTVGRIELATITITDADSPQAQAHQRVQAAVRFLAGQEGMSNVLVTSASQSEGKTTLASNLAISMALANIRTVLVDVDLRRPRVHKAYELDQSPGLTTVVVDDIDVVGAATIVPNSDENLAVVPAGKLPPHAASFISSFGFREAVKELSKLSDFTVFDAPPVLPVADTLMMSQLVDGVIIVAYANATKRADFEQSIESLHNSGARVLGAVLLGASQALSTYEYADTAGDLEHM